MFGTPNAMNEYLDLYRLLQTVMLCQRVEAIGSAMRMAQSGARS